MRLRPVLVALALSLLACAGMSRESGVCLPNQLDETARGYIRDKQLLQEGEDVRAYYDTTVSLDGSEIALVTDKRIVYHKEGVTTAFALADVTNIERSEVALGDAFIVTTRDGQMLQVEIAALNGGDTWERALDGAWKAAQAGQ
ncbi:MAG: PH domain-containing protein [Myxococcota bacterium]